MKKKFSKKNLIVLRKYVSWRTKETQCFLNSWHKMGWLAPEVLCTGIYLPFCLQSAVECTSSPRSNVPVACEIEINYSLRLISDQRLHFRLYLQNQPKISGSRCHKEKRAVYFEIWLKIVWKKALRKPNTSWEDRWLLKIISYIVEIFMNEKHMD